MIPWSEVPSRSVVRSEIGPWVTHTIMSWPLTVSTISLGQSVGTASFGLTANGVSDIQDIDTAIAAVSAQRTKLGAVQNRLEHAMNSLSTYQENLVASQSRIKDVDMASEMVEFTKDQILQQAGTSMLSQANQLPNSVLSLLR